MLSNLLIIIVLFLSCLTVLFESDSISIMPISRPCAVAKRLPCTIVPTITDAGPTSETVPPTRQNYMNIFFLFPTQPPKNN